MAKGNGLMKKGYGGVVFINLNFTMEVQGNECGACKEPQIRERRGGVREGRR